MRCIECRQEKRPEEFGTGVRTGMLPTICKACTSSRSSGSSGLGDLVAREYTGRDVSGMHGSALIGMSRKGSK